MESGCLHFAHVRTRFQSSAVISHEVATLRQFVQALNWGAHTARTQPRLAAASNTVGAPTVPPSSPVARGIDSRRR